MDQGTAEMTRERFALPFLVWSVLAPALVVAEEPQKLLLVIVVNRSPLKGDSKEFHVTVNAEERIIGGEVTKAELISRQGLTIEEVTEKRSVQPNDIVTHLYNVKLPDKDLNLTELVANLFSISKTGEKKILEHTSYVLDFNLAASAAKIVWSLPDNEVLTSGEPKRVYLRLKTDKGWFTPTATVQLELSSENCADFQSIPEDSKEKLKPFASTGSVNIIAEEPHSEEFYIRPSTWSSAPCNVSVKPKVLPNYPLENAGLIAQIKPNIAPALIMAMLGAFGNYLLGGLVQLLALIRSNGKNVFSTVFIGPKGSEIISMVLKGILAFVAAAVLIRSNNVFGIEIEKNSLTGFLSLGFMFGFWPVERLWKLFEAQHGPRESNAPTAPPALNTGSTSQVPSKES